jgi:hypothetical protein
VTDFDIDPLVREFAEFRDEVAPHVRSAGVAKTRRTVRVRRRNHMIAAGILTALAIVVPAAAYGTHRETVPAGPIRPPGPVQDLGNATLDLPPWAPDALLAGCPSGRLVFRNDSHPIGGAKSIHLEQVVHADVDHDGTVDAVARFACVDAAADVSTYQVVAFAADNAMRGQVAVQTGPVKAICDLRADADGTVSIEVGDFPAPLRCLVRQQAPLMKTQWRTYAWTGAQFAQSAGPTSFPRVVTIDDLRVFTDGLVVFNGDEGIMDFTVGNNGKSPVPYQAVFAMPAGTKLKSIEGGCAGPPPGYRGGNLACGGTVDPQTGLWLMFRFTRTDARRQTTPITVHVRPSPGYTDPNLTNNDVSFTFRYR